VPLLSAPLCGAPPPGGWKGRPPPECKYSTALEQLVSGSPVSAIFAKVPVHRQRLRLPSIVRDMEPQGLVVFVRDGLQHERLPVPMLLEGKAIWSVAVRAEMRIDYNRQVVFLATRLRSSPKRRRPSIVAIEGAIVPFDRPRSL
jgi:hypothetical protein